MSADPHPHYNQADIHRFLVRVIAPALEQMPLLPPWPASNEMMDVPPDEIPDMLTQFTTNEVGKEARRSFVLALDAIFNRQLVRYWHDKISIASEPDFASLLKAVAKALSVDLSDLSITLTEMHLVANVVRHSEGKSLDRLWELAPTLWPEWPTVKVIRNMAEDMRVTDQHFLRYGGAVATFWGRGNRLPLGTAEVRYPNLLSLLRSP